jgi:hypothetical protein
MLFNIVKEILKTTDKSAAKILSVKNIITAV